MSALLARLDADLDEAVDLSLGALPSPDVVRLLDAATRLRARATAMTARVAVEADRRRLGDEIGARHTAAWWAGRSRLTRGETIRLVRLGRLLESPLHSPVAVALSTGLIHADQAEVIVGAVDDLPSDLVDDALRSHSRDVLLEEAAEHDARALRVLGGRVLDVVAPQAGESHEQRLLEREEQAAAARAHLVLVDDGHGRCHGRFSTPTLHGEMLRGHLHALANPRRHPHDLVGAEGLETSPHGPVVTPELLGQALMEYVERYPVDRLPDAGGNGAVLAVTMTVESLSSGLGGATLDSGARISASEGRRLACGADLVPAVLGTRSQVLDLGRTARLFSPAQRRALAVRDGGCTADWCGLPPSVCHAHHDDPWSAGGPTDLANGRLLCPRHHRLAHDPRYAMGRSANGRVGFHRRT